MSKCNHNSLSQRYFSLEKETRGGEPRLAESDKEQLSKYLKEKKATNYGFAADIWDKWSGHGTGGGDIQTTDSDVMTPSDFDGNKVSSQLQFLIFASCKSGEGKKDWEKLITKQSVEAQYEGWEKNTTVPETNDFASNNGRNDANSSHNGLHPDKELDDYIDDAEDDVIADKKAKEEYRKAKENK